jgi:hypothetical protein
MGDRWHSLVCDGTCSPPCENAPAAASAAQAVDAAEALAAIARFAKADHPNSSATFKERKEAREQIDAIAARIGAIDGPAPAPEAMTSGTLQTQLVSALKRLEQANDELCKLRTSEQYLSMIDGGQQDALYELDNAREAARQAVAAAEAMTSDQQAAHPDDLAVDRFAAAMKSKLAQKRGEGRGGWETAECADEFLAELLMGHTKKGDPVDVANFAMMLHQRNLDDMDIAVLVLRSAALEFAKRTAPMFMREAAHAQQPAAQAVCAPRWLKDTCNQGYQVERCATCGTYKGNPCRLSTPPAAAPSVSATWQWVPKIPTQAMIDNIAAFVDGRENDAEVIYRAMIAAAPTAGAAATSDDAALLDFLDTNVHKFRMGWQVGAAPVGNLSVRAIIMGGQPIREAIRSAMSAHQEPRHE